jgi:hypothetical protein
LFFTLFLLFIRFLPMMAMAEVKRGQDDCSDDRIAGRDPGRV